MPYLVVIQLMRVNKWPQSHSHGSCVNKKGRVYKGFYSSSQGTNLFVVFDMGIKKALFPAGIVVLYKYGYKG